MASPVGEASSSSSMPRSYTYKVFLSFSGKDTYGGFTSHLYAALVNRGITTYIDRNYLQKGDVISDELFKAIEESMFAVVVLSPNYASSTWCLDELQKIVECKSNLDIVAVFYDVKPGDVRHQIGVFEEAFKMHEDRYGKESERVTGWRKFLKQIASYSNWVRQDFENDAILVELIAQHIHKRLIEKSPPSDDLVGVAAKLEEVDGHISIGVNDVRFIGIWGIGGVGKTTIARRVFKTIQSEFEASCFLSNVRVRCENGGIVQLQKQLLDRMNSNTTFYDEFEGKDLIRDSVCNKKVLLVLDDVDDVGQLDNLAGAQDWFGPGSRIIITSRDRHVLDVHGVNRICKVEELEQNEAHELFCLKAFKKPKPEEGYMDLSKGVVQNCDGLPLALVVLGSHLCRQPFDVWHSAIEKLKSSMHDKIFNILKISYDGLDPSQQDIFLHIACFFKGCNTDYATHTLRMCGYHVGIDMATLMDKSLLTIINDGHVYMLDMHDLLEEMGKQIVIKESLDDPSKRSRRWSYKDIDLVPIQNKGIDATYQHNMSLKVYWSKKLIILDCVEACIHGNIPCSVKVLHWTNCPMETLPLIDQHKELVEIYIPWSSIVHVWHGKKFLDNLEQLDLSRCQFLEQTPDISGAPNLKIVNLEECQKLSYIHPSFAHHKSLVELNLEGCESLETLADKMEMSSLKKLNLCKCTSLRRLPEFGECMNQLSVLSLSDTKIEELPRTFGNLVGLSYLDLSEFNFDGVPINILEFPMLTCLILRSCYSLKTLPNLPSRLRALDASDCMNLHSWNSSNVISKACCGFAESAKQDGEDLLQMVIPGKEIPAWFEHQEEGDAVSVPFPHNCPSTETLSLALCFLLDSESRLTVQGQPVVSCNGKELVNQILFEVSFSFLSRCHLLIVCLNSYYFSNLLCEPNCFQMSFMGTNFRSYNDLVKRCGARWVCKQDTCRSSNP
ncbi:hypothetical protein PIB30_043892 [Stylosanthes scabra]|uniref:ADP-ribosyl cyclase/cyclic ADP-ribose hydrolase n=1 Tax=Stylosanthes scabra TaxID=79078 RepID=A0ABU6TFD1_9FABA|nr:hypothetical protein [Stylosanthes scabra]